MVVVDFEFCGPQMSVFTCAKGDNDVVCQKCVVHEARKVGSGFKFVFLCMIIRDCF